MPQRSAPKPPRPFAVAMGHNLRMARIAKGLSLAEVASAVTKAVDDLEREESAIGHYERGRRSCPTEVLAFLSQLYGVPLGQLFPKGDPSVDNMRNELSLARGQIVTLQRQNDQLKGVNEMFTEWMRLAKSTNPELAQLDAQVSPPNPQSGPMEGQCVLEFSEESPAG